MPWGSVRRASALEGRRIWSDLRALVAASPRRSSPFLALLSPTEANRARRETLAPTSQLVLSEGYCASEEHFRF